MNLSAGSAECALTILPDDDGQSVRVDFRSHHTAAVDITWSGELQADGIQKISGMSPDYTVLPGSVRLAATGPASYIIRFSGEGGEVVPLVVHLADRSGAESSGTLNLEVSPGR